MGCRILHDGPGEMAVMYCSTSGWAFGPVFEDSDGHDAVERLEMFIEWLPLDPRKYNDSEMSLKYGEFLSIENDLWKEKEQEVDDGWIEPTNDSFQLMVDSLVELGKTPEEARALARNIYEPKE